MLANVELVNDGFDWGTAFHLARASQLSYLEACAIAKSAGDEYEVDTFEAGKAKNIEFVCVSAGQSCLLAIRGSDSFADWVGNLDLLPTEQPYGRVHSGFREALDQVRSKLMNALKRAGAADKQLWLTGHSLGGAIATMAALELKSDFPLGGVYTYGQPAFAKSEAVAATEERLAGQYFRLVNDQDLVAKLPPNYTHFGALYRFDRHGEVHTGVAAAEIEGMGAESLYEPAGMMSEDELSTLQDDIRKHTENVKSHRVRGADGILSSTLEGLIPGVADHAIAAYVGLIRQQVSRLEDRPKVTKGLSASLSRRASAKRAAQAVEADWLKPIRGPDSSGTAGPIVYYAQPFDPEFRVTVAESVPNSSLPEPPGEHFSVMVRLAQEAWQAPKGAKVLSKLGTVASLYINNAQLQTLVDDPQVLSVDLSRDGGVPELSDSREFVNASQIQASGVDERGDRAIIGIIDTGIDILHETFLDAARGATRIVGIWDQYDPNGPTPKDVDPSRFTADFGRLYTQQDIEAFLAGPPANVPRPLRDEQGHGTHVASIAAGRSVGAMANGIAPDSHLLAVIPAMRPRPGSPFSIGYSTSHHAALEFLTQAADGDNALVANARPIVINVSLGMNAGPHDGKSLLEVGFNTITKEGTVEGRVVVKSAGNERGHKIHSEETITLGVKTIEWDSEDKLRREDYLEAWFGGGIDATFWLTAPDHTRLGPVSINAPALTGNAASNEIQMELETNHRDNGDNVLILKISDPAGQIQPGTWVLDVVGNRIVGDPKIDFWFERNSTRCTKFVDASNNTTISVPGTAEHVIAVAATNSANPPRLHDRSSRGLTRRDKAKPDLSAPGTAIRAAKAGGSPTATTIKSGTSMAAPHVTGALALAMSARAKRNGSPQFTGVQLRSALINSTQFSHGYHDPGFGFGVLDIEAFFARLQP